MSVYQWEIKDSSKWWLIQLAGGEALRLSMEHAPWNEDSPSQNCRQDQANVREFQGSSIRKLVEVDTTLNSQDFMVTKAVFPNPEYPLKKDTIQLIMYGIEANRLHYLK